MSECLNIWIWKEACNMRRDRREKKRNDKKYVFIIVILVLTIGASFFLLKEKNVKLDKIGKNIKQVEIIAVGDNIFHDSVIAAGKNDDGTYDYTEIYSEIAEYTKAADIAIVNQETILGGRHRPYTGYPIFNTPWEAGHALEKAGFDILTCASNHSLDVGEKGIRGALEFFEENKQIKEVGINGSKEEYETIDYYEKNGIKFALLNYTYGTNGIRAPADKPWLVNMMDKEKITKDVLEARDNADVVMVFPHWGTEYSTEVSAYQEEYSKLFVELGVDIVIGTHPHVIEKVEWLENSNTGKKTLIYYSLGNFVSNQPDAIMQLGAMARIRIVKEEENIKIESAEAIPLITHVEDGNRKKIRSYLLDDYSQELADKNHSKSNMEYFEETAKKILGEFISFR